MFRSVETVFSGRATQPFCGVWRAGKRTIGARGSVLRFVLRFVQRFCVRVCMPVRAVRRLRRPESETCKIRSDMRKTNVMQIVRLVMMIAAVAGVIYALEYMERGIAVWFWITLLGVGFVGLLYTFRLTQRRVRLERRAKERQEKKKSRRQTR